MRVLPTMYNMQQRYLSVIYVHQAYVLCFFRCCFHFVCLYFIPQHGHSFHLTWPRGCKTFSCSTQLSTKFQLPVLIKTKIPTTEDVFVFIMLMNVKMQTIVGILTFMSRMNFVLS